MSLVKTAGSQIKGWVKTTVGTIFGLFSGAVVMWFSPLIDNFVKPAKPIANFAYHAEGLTVTFENRSSGSAQVCWDFGDGSPLEFVPGDHPKVQHTYKKPGKFNVKLTARNIVDEVNERLAWVDLEEVKSPGLLKSASAKDLPQPEILDLSARKLVRSAPAYAPATFVFDACVENAQQLIWDFGDGQGLQLADANLTWTFDRAGTYEIRLAAFNGRQKKEIKKTVVVEEPPANALQLVVTTVDEGVALVTETQVKTLSMTKAIEAGVAGSGLTIREAGSPGSRIVRAELLEDLSQDVKDVVCFITPDQHAVALSGTIQPPLKLPSGSQALALLSGKVRIAEEREVPTRRESEPHIVTLATAGERKVRFSEMPITWKQKNRTFKVELRQGDQVVWRGDALPTDVPVTVAGKPAKLSATASDSELTLTIR